MRHRTVTVSLPAEIPGHEESEVKGRSAALPTPRVTKGAEMMTASVLGVLGAVPIVRYLWVVAHRITFPFELEWMEGGTVEVVRRVAEGHNIYGPPSLSFTPWPYPPLYFWVSAAVSKVTGVGFLPLRLVSVCASLAVLWLLYRLVVTETGDRISGVVTAGLYAATYSLSGAWTDIGRVDSLFLALALGATVVARRAETRRGGMLVGLLFFLSFFTKQDALLIAAPVILWLLATRWRAGAVSLGVLGGLVVASTVVLDAFSNGWYQYYVFGELSSQGTVPENWVDFWRYDVFHPLVPVVLLSAGGLVFLVTWRRLSGGGWGLHWRTSGFWVCAAVGLLGAAWAGRLHQGGYNDVLIPAYAALALCGGLVVGMLRRHPLILVRLVVSAVVIGVVWVQLDRIAYPVGRQVPSSLDRRDGEAFLSLLRRLPGQVVVFDHPYYSTMVGKGSFADGEAVRDIERSGPSRARQILLSEIHAALLDPDIGAVILDDPGEEQSLGAELEADFRPLRAPAVRGRGFFPVTDLPLRPTLVFVRKHAALGRNAALATGAVPGTRAAR